MSINFATIYNFFITTYGFVSSHLPFGYALPPIRATIEITYNCNLKCQMCYLNAIRHTKQPIRDMSETTIRKIIDQMPPNTLIGLTGGEIFTKPYIFNLIAHATRHHYCNIVTNGTLITPVIAKKIVESDILVIGISIDGPQHIHDNIRGVQGAFQKSIRAIQLIQQEKRKQHKQTPKVDVKLVILPENYQYIKEIFTLCQKLNVDFFTLSTLKSSPIQLAPPIVPTIQNKAYRTLMQPEKNLDVDILRQQIDWITKQKSTITVRFYPRRLPNRLTDYYNGKTTTSDYDACTFPWASFNVSPNGALFPCIALDIGNLQHASLTSLWNSKKMRQFRQRLKKEHVFPACHGCCNLWFTTNKK